jgi:hypothetical protein
MKHVTSKMDPCLKALRRAPKITDATRQAYIKHLQTLLAHMRTTRPGLDMRTMLLRGRAVVRAIESRYQAGSSACAALSAVLAVHRMNLRLRRGAGESWSVLKRAMARHRCRESARYKAHAASHQQVHYVSMKDIADKFQ